MTGFRLHPVFGKLRLRWPWPDLYRVRVRNLRERTVAHDFDVLASTWQDAMMAGPIKAFREKGWHHCQSETAWRVPWRRRALAWVRGLR